jgi:hypothetical protein
MIIALFFKKKVHFFAETWENRLKLVIITSDLDWPIGEKCPKLPTLNKDQIFKEFMSNIHFEELIITKWRLISLFWINFGRCEQHFWSHWVRGKIVVTSAEEWVGRATFPATTKAPRIRKQTCARKQGCQIFLGPSAPKREKCTKLPHTILYQMAIKYKK